jgi:hypothetical protein
MGNDKDNECMYDFCIIVKSKNGKLNHRESGAICTSMTSRCISALLCDFCIFCQPWSHDQDGRSSSPLSQLTRLLINVSLFQHRMTEI